MIVTAILTFVIALLIVLSAIPPIIRVAQLKHLFDEPSEDRKVHIYKTPNLGGIAIFVSLLLTLCVIIPFNLIPHVNYIIASAVILFCLGLKDDLVGLSPLIKFAAQIVAALVICLLAGIRLTSLYGFFGIYEISVPLSMMITTLFILLIVNAFNLIDGIDCLAGTVGIITSISFGYVFFALKEPGMMYLAICITGSLCGFLYFNRSPAKIFMGDTGSLLIGFVMAVMSIKFIELNKFNPVTNLHPLFVSAPSMVFGILIIPIFDTLRVFTLRVTKGLSPFNADRNHIHHRLIDFRLSHLKATGILSAVNIFFIIIVFLLKDIGTMELFIFTSILALTLNLTSWHFANVKRMAISEQRPLEYDNVVKLDGQGNYVKEQVKNQESLSK